MYGIKANSETTKFIKRFLSDMNGMGAPGCFCADNGGGFTSREYIDLYDAALIRREYTTPDPPKQNGLTERAIYRIMRGGHTARRHILSQSHVDLASIPSVHEDRFLLLASVIWASDCCNRSAIKANTSWSSPNE